jgi:DNA-binding MarR family transcriptional regulator
VTDRRLFLKAYTLAQHVEAVVVRELAAVGVPSHLFGLLTHVRHLEPVTPSRLSAVSGAPMTTLRDNIQRLVDRKLVERTPNPADGRSYLVTLTERGELLARAADPALLRGYLAVEERLPRPLGEYEAVLDELIAAVSEVSASAEAEPERTSA